LLGGETHHRDTEAQSIFGIVMARRQVAEAPAVGRCRTKSRSLAGSARSG
jgi:hypothetical protein